MPHLTRHASPHAHGAPDAHPFACPLRAPLCLAALLWAGTVAVPTAAWARAGAACDPVGEPQQVDACAVRDFQAADIRLGIRYREAMESLPVDRRVALRQQQRGWLRSRDSDCKAATRAHEGGSAWSRSYYACLERATTGRIGELDRWQAAAQP